MKREEIYLTRINVLSEKNQGLIRENQDLAIANIELKKTNATLRKKLKETKEDFAHLLDVVRNGEKLRPKKR